MEERDGCFALFVFLVSHDCFVAFPTCVTDLSAVCDCGIFWSYSIIFFSINITWPSKRHKKRQGFINMVNFF